MQAIELVHITGYHTKLICSEIELLKEYRKILESKAICDNDKVAHINRIIQDRRYALLNNMQQNRKNYTESEYEQIIEDELNNLQDEDAIYEPYF